MYILEHYAIKNRDRPRSLLRFGLKQPMKGIETNFRPYVTLLVIRLSTNNLISASVLKLGNFL